jgi:hypothetical protein
VYTQSLTRHVRACVGVIVWRRWRRGRQKKSGG